jgi:hypothetical protein
MKYAMVDATIVKVHRHGRGAKMGIHSQAIGRSKGGMTTKILALTDALGNLVRFVLLPGHRFDTVGVAPLIDGLAFDGFIADKDLRQQFHHCLPQRARRQDRHLTAFTARLASADRR